MNSARKLIRQVKNGETDTRVRATWRGVVPWAVGFGAQVLTMAVALLAVRRVFDLSEVGGRTAVVLQIGLLGAASALGLLTAITIGKWLDARSLSGYGVDVSGREVADWAAGTVIGGLTYAVPTLVFSKLGGAEVTAAFTTPIEDTSVVAVVIVVAIASFGLQTAFEEFAFRGVMFKNFVEGIAARGCSHSWAVLISLLASSLLFGVSHVITQGGGGAEGRSVQLVITSALLGVLWGGAYVLTGRLSIPFGLHFGHNLWAAVVLQPTEVGLELPALGQVAYSVGRYELAVSKLIVGAVCVLVWLYGTRDELTIELKAHRVSSSD